MKMIRDIINTMLIVILAITSSTVISLAQTEKADNGKMEIKINPTSKARIKFLEDYWEFGSIPLNSIVVHDFPIKNTGTDTLIITAVKPTCGCTTAPLESDKIAPGETTSLHVTLNTKKLNGLVRKFVNIECNDPISPYLRISFKAVINDPKQVFIPSPIIADFGKVLKGEKQSLTIELRNAGSDDMDLSLFAKPDENLISISMPNKSLKAGEVTELKFDLTDKFEAGPIVSSITIEAEGQPNTRITIPIAGTVME